MNEKEQEKLKQLLEMKKAKQGGKQKMIPEKSIGSGQNKGKSNIKVGGSNNKV